MSLRAHFTPSLHDGPKLEQLFVNREPMLEQAVARIADAANSGRLSHTLFTGPRGSGKTHLISLIHYRATQLDGYGTRFTMAWLPEDPWTILDYDCLAEAIDEAREHPDAPLTVVLAEGFDRILENLGTDGQHRLRARIERDENLLLIASTTRLSNNLVAQAKPFYGFFTTIHLKPFTLDEAIAMLRRSAEIDGDKALAARLQDSDVKARLAAIEQLAGGQPRLWALLSSGLTVDDLDDLFDLLVTQFDDLTPYYQEQLGSLSPNELRIVMALIRADHAMTTREIAAATGIAERTVSTTIRRLRPAWLTPYEGLLQKYVDKRLTYYELAEPLARVALQIKAARGEPVRLVVDFLSAWYSRNELETYAATAVHAIEREYVQAALDDATSTTGQLREHLLLQWPTLHLDTNEPLNADPNLVVQADRIDQALAALQHDGSATDVLALPVAIASLIETQLATTSVGLLRIELALLAVRQGSDETWLDRAIDALSVVRENEERVAAIATGAIQALLGQFDQAVQVLHQALATSGYEPLTDAEWNIIATTMNLTLDRAPVSTHATVLNMIAPLVQDDDAAELAEMAVKLFATRSKDRLDLTAVVARLAANSPSYPAQAPNFDNPTGTASVESLEEAITLQHRAVSLTDPDRPNYATQAASLGVLIAEAAMDGVLPTAALAEAITWIHEAVHRTDLGHPNYPMYASTLSNLMTQAVRAGVLPVQSLYEAVDLQRQAITLTNPNHPNYPMYASNLGTLIAETVQAGILPAGQLAEAIDYQRQAVDRTDPHHPDYPAYASNLGTLIAEAVQAGILPTQQLADAIDYQRQAVEHTDPNHPNYPMYASNLGNRIAQAVQAGILPTQQLADAVDYQRQAVTHTNPDIRIGDAA